MNDHGPQFRRTILKKMFYSCGVNLVCLTKRSNTYILVSDKSLHIAENHRVIYCIFYTLEVINLEKKTDSTGGHI